MAGTPEKEPKQLPYGTGSQLPDHANQQERFACDAFVDRIVTELTSQAFYDTVVHSGLERKEQLREVLKKILRFCQSQIPPEVPLSSVFWFSGSADHLAVTRYGINTLSQLESALATNFFEGRPGFRGRKGYRRLERIDREIHDYYSYRASKESNGEEETPA